MYKLESKIANYRFNTVWQQGVNNIIWFVLDKTYKDDEFARCFTQEELSDFLHFMSNNQHNFPNNKNYHACQEDSDDSPICDYYNDTPINSLHPTNIIIRKNPSLKAGGIYSCMDIILTDNNGNYRHPYNLNFNAIGKFY